MKKVAIALILLTTGCLSIQILNIFLADIFFTQEQSIQNYTQAIKLNPKEPAYFRELATLLALTTLTETENQINWAVEANTIAVKAYQLNPYNSLTLKALLYTYSQLGKVDVSYQEKNKTWVRELILLSPTEAQVYYSGALVYLRSGEVEEAKILNARALELKENYEKARELQELLHILTQNPGYSPVF